MPNTNDSSESIVAIDSIDSYFECITSCSLNDEDIECFTQCVSIHLKEEFE